MIPIAFKELAFTSFVLLFYSQVVGLPAAYASAALFIALVVDSVSDPLVGAFSDNFSHRLGRRHPLMYAACVPMALALWALFSPPQASDTTLFVWLLVTAVATRLAFTFFAVPWGALFAELTSDYVERSELLAYRFAVGLLGGFLLTIFIWQWVFVGTPDESQGQLIRENYTTFAWVIAASVASFGLLTTWLTRDQIPYLPQPVAEAKFNARLFWGEVKLAAQNREFVILFFAVIASGVVNGTTQALQLYMNTYFWGMGGDELRWMAFALFGGVLGFLTVVPIQTRVDKKYVLATCSVSIILISAVPVTLRLLEVAPANGDGGLVILLVGTAFLVAYFGTLGLIMFASMVADTVDLQDLQTGRRQEGLFNSAMSFSGKVTTGGGILVTGVLLQYVVGLPEGVDKADVDAEMIMRLGVLEAYVVPLFNGVWLWLALKYGVTRERHAEIRRALARREDREYGIDRQKGEGADKGEGENVAPA